MIVKRDLLGKLQASTSLEAVLLWGPRQVGKTTLLMELKPASTLFLDDLSLRQRAQKDPAFVLDDHKLPCLIDEVQYAPNIFSEIKLRIDRLRRTRLKTGKKSSTLYYLTGSNRLLLDQNVKESLAGRCHLYSMHGFSVREILAHFPELPIKTLLWRGGFPELYINQEMSPQRYLNDYILSFIEKDIAASAGIEKLGEFQTVLGLLAARTAQFLNVSEVAGAAGVDQKTIQSWIDILQRNHIIELVEPFHSNLSKRITKMKKLFFYDVGLCARLQGHNDESLLWNSSQAGGLFETLVFSEIIKTKDNFLKDWRLFTWRTKEKNEIDFILQNGSDYTFLEAKLAIHGAMPFKLDAEAKKVFKLPHKKIVVIAGGEQINLDKETMASPIHSLGSLLLK
ncbi:MAG: ATP-binding protein [Oligoflexia bacterium]|nr:ATP-binding protein [Oligoflexia bacterium]